MTNVDVIARKSLHGGIANLLRDMIFHGKLKPGDKVPVEALCARFHVSRTPVREATKVLAAEGLLQLLPNRGAVVARITSAEIEALLPIMGVLEGLAGELACQQITDAEISQIRAMHVMMISCYEENKHVAYAKLNRAIHEAFFKFARNPLLAAYFQNLIVRTHGKRFVASKSREHWGQAIEDHRRMMTALEMRNGALLADILRDHVRRELETVNEALLPHEVDASNTFFPIQSAE